MATDRTEQTSADPMHSEQEHLKQVLTQLENHVQRLREAPRYFSDDNSEPQTADEVAQQVVDVIRDEEAEALSAAMHEPYFGRLDYCESDEDRSYPMYIGKRGIEDPDTKDRTVIDWRAPVASMFYSFTGKGSQASYPSPEGVIDCEVYLKRNIVIRDRELQRVVDSYVYGQENLNVTDEFLLYRLSEHKDSRLRDIVSSIQAEQDAIIRQERAKAVFIQGVAGSGKTTVALHRLAFLLYQHQDRLRTERMVIFAPNSMFVDYISEVLPELGVGGVKQTTFAAWALRMLNQTVKLRDPALRLERWFALKQDPELTSERAVTTFKGSMQFASEIDQFLSEVESSMVPDMGFIPWDGAELSADVIRDWFTTEYSHYPLAQRRDRVLARVKRWYESEYRNNPPLDPSGNAKKQAGQRFRTYSKKWPEVSPYDVYQQVLSAHRSLPVDVDTAKRKSKRSGGKRRTTTRPLVEYEDLAPLLYILLQLEGVDGKETFDHVVIDEAQDSSALQLSVLKAYCPSQSFTVLGDLSQSIHSYQGISRWDQFLALFPEEKRAFFTLDVSYRSTMEIIEFANHVIRRFEGFDQAKPVFRSGEPVNVQRVSRDNRVKKAVEAVSKARTHANTVAVVCRTQADCQAYYDALAEEGYNPHLIDATEQHYQGGVSVLPIYLTKGLEFDSVILVDVNATNYDDSVDSAKLLYVGCTRALHHLQLFYIGKRSPLLDFSDADLDEASADG